MFHYLLDLPCVAAAVETREKLQANNDSVLETLVDFITRNESGSTDTVDKLKQLHGALKFANKSYSVVSCSKNVATLLEYIFFREKKIYFRFYNLSSYSLYPLSPSYPLIFFTIGVSSPKYMRKTTYIY